MKIFVKTLKGTNFEIDVKPEDTVADVKKYIETSQGISVYPAEQQMLIHQGKILKDNTTLDENKVCENSFLVIMLSKTKGSSSEASGTTKAPPTPVSSTSAVVPTPTPAVTQAPAPTLPSPPASAPVPTAVAASTPTATIPSEADPYGQAASNLVAGSTLEQTIQQIVDMGGGTWDRDTVIRSLRAAYNNPERAVEYLYSGIPENTEPPPVARTPASGQTTSPSAPASLPVPSGGQAANPSVQTSLPVPAGGGPNANPLDLFPQGLPNIGSNTGGGSLDFLRNNPQFRAVQAMVQSNPQILQPLLQELLKQNPQMMRLIQEHQGEFLRLINEPAEGAEGSNILGQMAGGMPQAINITPEERESIERLEAMGFDRALVLQVFFACNKNEELAANYLLDHHHEFDD